MTRLPGITKLIDSGIAVFSKEWKHLSSAVILLSLPLYLISLGLETNKSLYIPYLILLTITAPLISIITTTMIYYRYNKKKTIHSKGVYQYIHDRFFPVLGTSILSGIIMLVSLIFLIIPAAILGLIYFIGKPTLIVGTTLTTFGLTGSLILAVSSILILIGVGTYIMFALPISILEKEYGLKAINKSIKLVKGRWWNIFGRIVILQVIGLFIAGIVSLFGAAIVGTTNLGMLITTLLQQVAILPISIAMIVLYLDINEKKIVKKRSTKSTSKKTRKTTTKRSSKKSKK